MCQARSRCSDALSACPLWCRSKYAEPPVGVQAPKPKVEAVLPPELQHELNVWAASKVGCLAPAVVQCVMERVAGACACCCACGSAARRDAAGAPPLPSTGVRALHSASMPSRGAGCPDPEPNCRPGARGGTAAGQHCPDGGGAQAGHREVPPGLPGVLGWAPMEGAAAATSAKHVIVLPLPHRLAALGASSGVQLVVPHAVLAQLEETVRKYPNSRWAPVLCRTPATIATIHASFVSVPHTSGATAADCGGCAAGCPLWHSAPRVHCSSSRARKTARVPALSCPSVQNMYTVLP